jgi:iron(III) transport system ATP-binding protein
MSISDEIVVMNAGVVEQVGTPHAIYARPSSRFVADFIGKANFLATTVVDGETVEVAGVRLPVALMPARRPGEAVSAVLRPEAIHISPGSGLFKGTVRRVMFLGNIAEYLIEVEGAGQWIVDSANPAEAALHQLGEAVFLTPSRHALHLLP